MTENISAFERENKFYYGKLRLLEIMCDGLNADTDSVYIKDILQVLYNTEEVRFFFNIFLNFFIEL